MHFPACSSSSFATSFLPDGIFYLLCNVSCTSVVVSMQSLFQTTAMAWESHSDHVQYNIFIFIECLQAEANILSMMCWKVNKLASLSWRRTYIQCIYIFITSTVMGELFFASSKFLIITKLLMVSSSCVVCNNKLSVLEKWPGQMDVNGHFLHKFSLCSYLFVPNMWCVQQHYKCQ